ncbi:MAG TPA: tRNA (adenosine(37)-N6)-threonylcarbamoyltransferase complex dimerization subunit type 1 TsaB [Mycobacteriales bacterium]|nr:tRNA (adenosine(37)-N6)-threonylcarbamoyltransferase complex dimerization subunit type 1 TsaB [Mycobacteriales bacterium]
MLILALDTSSSTVTVALCEVVDGEIRTRAERQETAANRHGERLASLIAAALAESRAHPNDLGAVVAGLGPGPFTGLRVGIVTARAMSDALGIPAYGVCSLDGIARRFVDDGPFAVVTDARRKQVYWALYDATGARTAGPELGPPDQVAAMLTARTTEVVGAGALLYPDAFRGFAISDGDPAPRAADLVWAADLTGEPGLLTPLYLRRPDAQPPGRPKAVTPR